MRTKIGIVKSAKMQNTVIVAVDRMVTHPRYLKKYKKTSTFAADTAGLEVTEGARVEIEETRPISKTKNWKVTKVLS